MVTASTQNPTKTAVNLRLEPIYNTHVLQKWLRVAII